MSDPAKSVVLMLLFATPISRGAGIDSAPGQNLSPPDAIRIALPGRSPGDGETRSLLTPVVREALERLGAQALPVPPSQWKDLAPAKTDFVLLSGGAVAALERVTDGDIETLRDVVARGVHLVVIGTAAGALPASRAFSELLGRVHREDRQAVATPAAPAEVAVAVLDQRHPVTQCVPHLLFERAVITATGDGGGSHVLAAAVGSAVAQDDSALARNLRVVFWTKRHRRGGVVVLGLEATQSDPPEKVSAEALDHAAGRRERELLATLLGRVFEWLKSRRVRLRLPAELPLAASRLGKDDAGLLPGLAPRKGFYRGRQIAPFMTYHGADWLTRPERERSERPEALLDSLRLKAGSTVADLGAGVGYFSERMARRVGPEGKVLAVDIQKEMLEMLMERMKTAGVTNVVPVLASAEDPRLSPNSLDLVLMVDVYHELSQTAQVIAHVHNALRKGGAAHPAGRVVLVEYRGEDPTVQIKPLHRMTVQQVRAELEPVGFRWVETKSFLPHQHVLIFERSDKEPDEAKTTKE